MVQLTLEGAADTLRLERQLDHVRELMADGQWRTLGEIKRGVEERTGGYVSETGVSARLRDLRRVEHGGFRVEARRRDGYRALWEYRVAR